MTERPIPRFSYDSQDYDFVENTYGLVDPTPGDGLIQWDEVSDDIKDFYLHLLPQENVALRTYRLSSNNFSQSAELAQIARKFLKWKFFKDHDLPLDIDQNFFDSPRYFPDTRKPTDRLFHEIIIDAESIRNDEELYDILLSGDLSCLSTITIEILRDFLLNHEEDKKFLITRDAWDKAFLKWNCQANPPYNAESTWNEMISIWHASDPDWNLIMNDQIFGTITGGLVRVAKKDFTITAQGIRAYGANPKRHVFFTTPSIDSISHMDIHTESVWPDHETRIPLMEKMGTALNLRTEPNARAVVNQKIRDGNLVFDVTEPLIYLEGFHLDLDANNWFTKFIASGGQWFTSWFGKDFDFGLYELFAITVYHGRLTLVFDGYDSKKDIVDPIAADDFLFLDVNDLIRAKIEELKLDGELADVLFDGDGHVRSGVSLTHLQDSVMQVLQNGSLNTSNPAINTKQFDGLRTELWVDDIDMDLLDVMGSSASLDRNGLESVLSRCEIENGRVYADVTLPHKIYAQGEMQLQLSIENEKFTNSTGNNDFVADVSFLVDTDKNQGVAKVEIPDVFVKNLSDAVDGSFQGAVYVALPAEIFASIREGQSQAQDLLEVIGAKLFVDLQKNHQDYLAAALHFRYQQDDENQLKTKQLLADYQIAFNDSQKKLRGVISGGEFTFLEEEDPTNAYLSQEFKISANKLVGGGLARLFADDSVIKVSQDAMGTWYFEILANKAHLENGFSADASNLSSLIIVHPITGLTGELEGYDVVIDDLSVTIPNVSIGFKNNKRLVGHTQARIEDGHWRIKASSLMDLFDSQNDWQGHGVLTLNNQKTSLKLIDTSTGAVGVFNGDQLDSQIQIDLMRFHPLKMNGDLNQTISDGVISFETDDFAVQSDVDGTIDVSEAKYPIVSFQTKETLNDVHASDVTATGDEQSEKLDPDINAILQDKFKSYLEELLHAPRSVFSAARVDLGSDLLLQGAESLIDLNFDVDHAKFYPAAEYNDRKRARIPLIQGFFAFLNPRVEKETEFHLSDPELVIQNNELQSIEWHLSQPIHFLGFDIHGFAIDTSKNGKLATKSSRLVIVTNHFRINPICLLKIMYPFKMAGFYKRANQILKKEGRDLSLDKNEMPTDLGDLVLFLEELARSIQFDKKLQERRLALSGRFQPSEFDNIKKQQLVAIEKAIGVFPNTPDYKTKNRKKRMAWRLNDLSSQSALSEQFTDDFLDAHFHGDAKNQALDLLEEIGRVQEQKRIMKLPFFNRIRKLNAKLLRLYLKPLVKKPQLIDIDQIKKLAVQSTLRPRMLDGGIIKFNKDQSEDVHLNVLYGAYERDDVVSKNDETPYLAVQIATADGEQLENVDFDFINRNLFFKGEFDKLSGIDFYLTGPLDEGSPFEFKIHQLDTTRNVQVLHQPDGYDRPAFAFVTSDHDLEGHHHDNIIDGGDLFVRRDRDGFYEAGVTFFGSDVHDGFLYFTFRDEKTGELRDAFVDQAANQYNDFKIDLGIQTSRTADGLVNYSFSKIKVDGGLVLIDHPQEQPRAYIYSGLNSKGEREYLELRRFVGDGDVAVDNSNISYAGNITIETEIPDLAYSHPFIQEIQKQGITLDLDGVEIDGTFAFRLDGFNGGIERLDPSQAKAEFIPTEFRLKGKISFEFEGQVVSLQDLKIPIQQFDLAFVRMTNGDGHEKQVPLINSFVVPKGEEIEAKVSAHVHLPQNLGAAVVGVEDADVAIQTESGIRFGMTDPKTFHFDTSGLQAQIIDQDFNNRLDLTAGEVAFHDDQGHIKTWKVTAEFMQLIQAMISVSLQGDLAQFNVNL